MKMPSRIGFAPAASLLLAARPWNGSTTPAAMDIGPKINQWHQPARNVATPDPRLADSSKINFIDYGFAKYGSSAERRWILAKWDAEIGSLPR